MARIRKEKQKLFFRKQKYLFYALLISGISTSLLGGFFMFDGDLFGKGTGDIARIMGYIGLAFIVASSTVAASAANNSDHR